MATHAEARSGRLVGREGTSELSVEDPVVGRRLPEAAYGCRDEDGQGATGPVTPPAARGTRELAAYYDAEAATEEELWAPVLVGPGRALLDALPLQGTRFVIDVGAGVGALLPTIVAAAPDATVIALDRSIGMLRRAATTTPRIVADAAAPPVRAGSMDVAVMAFVLISPGGPSPRARTDQKHSAPRRHARDPQRGIGESLSGDGDIYARAQRM